MIEQLTSIENQLRIFYIMYYKYHIFVKHVINQRSFNLSVLTYTSFTVHEGSKLIELLLQSFDIFLHF